MRFYVEQINNKPQKKLKIVFYLKILLHCTQDKFNLGTDEKNFSMRIMVNFSHRYGTGFACCAAKNGKTILLQN